jgi:hypothetical protein
MPLRVSESLGRRLGLSGGRKRKRIDVGKSAFAAACLAAGLPEPIPEFRWGEVIGRKWRADWFFRKGKKCVIAEQVGGVWSRGHHSRGQSQIDDFERMNEAQILGLLVIQGTPEQFESGAILETIARALL